MKKSTLITLLISLVLSPGLIAETKAPRIIESSEVQYQPLNPARGDASPRAGVLWGDIKANVPSGLLVKFKDGFSSPPHIHNITYRAVVINGSIHNADPRIPHFWMTPGSFWTQPAGENHITAARGDDPTIFLEIESGPYLVRPSKLAFENREKPINLDASNIVWIAAPGATSKNAAEVAYLWGKPLEEGQAYGSFVKLPADFNGHIKSQGSSFRAIVIKGEIYYQSSETKSQVLNSGSYFSSNGVEEYIAPLKAEKESILYIRTDGDYTVDSAN